MIHEDEDMTYRMAYEAGREDERREIATSLMRIAESVARRMDSRRESGQLTADEALVRSSTAAALRVLAERIFHCELDRFE